MSRIDAAMASWQDREKHYRQRYGEGLENSRAFAKVKLKAWKRTLRETRGLKLTEQEKDDRNILKSQTRDLERKLTPNPVLRFVKRVVERTQEVAVAAWGLAVRAIENRRNKNTADVLNTAQVDYAQGRNNGTPSPSASNAQTQDQAPRELPAPAPAQHQRSTPITGSDNPQVSFTNTHQNRLALRKTHRQRTVLAASTGKSQSL
ncbi:hypothetical protein [Chitinophaga sp. 212800010-3]|uniref:hypothetical protein n=1 Tax=unclassified Chitinophaga TaxID=2619133 RepID=UPI002DEF75A4|nr:Transposase [Chitinophaga sp. 212800010-3]